MNSRKTLLRRAGIPPWIGRDICDWNRSQNKTEAKGYTSQNDSQKWRKKIVLLNL